jgi:hypothetical protein
MPSLLALVLGLDLLLAMMWLTNACGVRARVAFSDSPRLVAATLGWLGLLPLAMVLVGTALATAPSPLPPAGGADSPDAQALNPVAVRKAAAAEHFASAVEYRAAGELGLALEAARQAVALWPEHSEARALLATVAPLTAAGRERPRAPTLTVTGSVETLTDTEVLPGRVQWIPGLTAADVTSVLEPHGFRCRGVDRGPGAGSYWTCKASANDALSHYEVEMVGDSATHIRSVSATIFQPRSVPSEQRAMEFLAVVGMLPYHGADPPRARQWVEEHIVSGGLTTIGDARLSLVGNPRVRSLKLFTAAAP